MKVNKLVLKFDRFPFHKNGKGIIGKTVQIRCGAAAVIGQDPETNEATAILLL